MMTGSTASLHLRANKTSPQRREEQTAEEMEEEEKDEIKQLDNVKPLRLSKVFTVDSDAIVSKLYLKENVLEVVYDDWINKLKEAKVSCIFHQSN